MSVANHEHTCSVKRLEGVLTGPCEDINCIGIFAPSAHGQKFW